MPPLCSPPAQTKHTHTHTSVAFKEDVYSADNVVVFDFVFHILFHPTRLRQSFLIITYHTVRHHDPRVIAVSLLQARFILFFFF